MTEPRKLYVVYTFITPKGPGTGRDTMTVSNLPAGVDTLDMAMIAAIEAEVLKPVREKAPDASGLFLTWWQWIRPDPSEAPSPDLPPQGEE